MANEAERPGSANQHPRDLMYNYDLASYACPGKNHKQHEYLKVQKWDCKVGDALMSVPPIKPRPGEISTEDDNCDRGLWVGMYPLQHASEQISEKKTGQGKKRASKTSVDDVIEQQHGFNLIDDEERALRVVVNLNNKTEKILFYALRNPNEEGICAICPIDEEDVFFCRLYRTDSTKVVEERRKEWPDIIRTLARQIAHASPAKEVRATRVFAIETATIPAAVSQSYDITGFLKDFIQNQTMQPIKEVFARLEMMDSWLRNRPTSTISNVLERLISINKPFDDSDAKTLLENMHVRTEPLRETGDLF